MGQPLVLRSVAALRAWRQQCRRAGETVGLVPTMGALHVGHLSLVNRIRQEADRAIVSIFVNPTQFAPNEDFSKYPRTFERDLQQLSEIGADAVFAPTVPEMYPDGFATTVTVAGPAKVGLEDAFRPTHFAGVATVVSKLLLQALPDCAIFGEKDYQQLAVIRHMVRDLDIPVEILAGPTVREADGLAMSSRNVYLSPEERALAPRIHEILEGCAAKIRSGAAILSAETWGRTELAIAGFEVDYIAIRDAASLAPVDEPRPGQSLRILVAAKLGRTRLIDNIAAG
ncbi:MAG: pantoate--beta-alanine ligase [Beijerinckiaceae bacterium]|nr:pantoate--beta-alanine ligase [Beijerinckiaceae bacterium]